MIFKDTQGVKGNKDTYQIRDGFDKWCNYYNPDANLVQSKEANNVALYKLDPVTDQTLSSMKWVTGKAGTHVCYIVGTKKSMTYYLRNTKKIKYYYTGSGGAAKALHLVVKEEGQGDGTTVQGPEAIGKSVNSNAVEAELDPTKRYTVTIIADSNGGDMLIYATKLWPGDASGIDEITDSQQSRSLATPHSQRENSQFYNLAGQRVGKDYKSLVIINGKKFVLK